MIFSFLAIPNPYSDTVKRAIATPLQNTFPFRLINALKPGSVKKINTMKMAFKQRENIELFLKGAADYGLKDQDLFQVS